MGPADPTLRGVFERYLRAIADPGAALPQRVEARGLVGGSGLVGRFHRWRTEGRERFDESLGPRTESSFYVAGLGYVVNGDGNVRSLTGIGLRRDRTQRAVADGLFVTDGAHCSLLGTVYLDHRRASLVSYAPAGGEVETIAFDDESGLPARIAYDEDDGTTTIDLSDWRTVAGRRYAFRAVESNGDRNFDVVLQTESIVADRPIDEAVYGVPPNRTIVMTGSQTVPIEITDGHLYVPIRLLGKSYRFLVDTGAQNVVLDTRVARELGLEGEGFLEASGAARTSGLQLASLADLQVGRGHLRDLVVTTLDLAGSTAGVFPIDGILGYPFFASTIARIDLSAKTMTFGPPGAFVPIGERVAVDVDREYPEATLRVNDAIEAPFIVDTGNTAELLLYRPFVTRNPGLVPEAAAGENSFGIGGATPSYRTTLDRLDLAGFPLYHLDTDVMLATRGAFADRVDAGNVGLGVLRNFATTFDESNGAIYLERGASFDDGRRRRS